MNNNLSYQTSTESQVGTGNDESSFASLKNDLINLVEEVPL